MNILNDQEIYSLAAASQSPVLDLDLKPDYRDPLSQIRAAAVDLRVGLIYVPGTDAGCEGSLDKPKTSHTLKSGETAIITPLESFDFPPDLVGLVFPSSQVSIHGLLMTNPGYIDPGYIGKLRFTMINMGERPYDIRQAMRIVTLILIRLDNRCTKSWRERKPGKQYLAPTADDLGKLSPDFLNVKQRVEEITENKDQEHGTFSDSRWRSYRCIAGFCLLPRSAGDRYLRAQKRCC